MSLAMNFMGAGKGGGRVAKEELPLLGVKTLYKNLM